MVKYEISMANLASSGGVPVSVAHPWRCMQSERFMNGLGDFLNAITGTSADAVAK